MEQTNGHTVAVWVNGSRLLCLPNKMPEVCRKERKERKKRAVHLCSGVHTERGFKVVRLLITGLYSSEQSCGASLGATVHYIPLQGNLMERLHSAEGGMNIHFF